MEKFVQLVLLSTDTHRSLQGNQIMTLLTKNKYTSSYVY